MTSLIKKCLQPKYSDMISLTKERFLAKSKMAMVFFFNGIEKCPKLRSNSKMDMISLIKMCPKLKYFDKSGVSLMKNSK